MIISLIFGAAWRSVEAARRNEVFHSAQGSFLPNASESGSHSGSEKPPVNKFTNNAICGPQAEKDSRSSLPRWVSKRPTPRTLSK